LEQSVFNEPCIAPRSPRVYYKSAFIEPECKSTQLLLYQCLQQKYHTN